MGDILWRKIPEFENYEISPNGEILRYSRSDRPLQIHGSTNASGTPQIILTNGSNRRRVVLSRLMLETFQKPHPIMADSSGGLVASFYNGDPKDCHIDNLYWSTRRNAARKAFLYNVSREEMTRSPVRCVSVDSGEKLIYGSVDECAKDFGRDPVEVFDMTDGFLDDGEWLYSWH